MFSYYYFQFTNKLAQLPGVLGIWRPDLQGKKRPGWNELERDIIVETNYGQIQGFKVGLFRVCWIF